MRNAAKKDIRIKKFIGNYPNVIEFITTDSVKELVKYNTEKLRDEFFNKIFTPELAGFIKQEGGLQNFGEETTDLVDFLVDDMQGTSSSGQLVNQSSGQSGDNSFLQCKSPLEKSSITFDDIAGQEEIKANITKNYIYPFTYPSLFKVKTKGILLYGPPGTGKCLSPEEKVVMYDGTLKMAKDVQEGDLLMGDDSTPRNVLSICSGIDEMYKIIPTTGEPFIVNEPHILSLVSTNKPRVSICKKEGRIKVIWMENGQWRSKQFTPITESNISTARDFAKSLAQVDYIDIPLYEYIDRSKSWKAQYKGYRVSADWDEQPIPFDPYMMGLWLGDGCSYHPWITNIDEEIIIEMQAICDANGLEMRRRTHDQITFSIVRGEAKTNVFRDTLKSLNLIKNKHIPQCYKTNSRSVRLQLLAGLLDSDGHLTCNCYEITQKNITLSEDIAFLARSLGFYVSSKEVEKTCTNSKNGPVTGVYQRMFISGAGLDEIPVRCARKKASPRKQIKNMSRFGFSVEHLGRGPYCGFCIDGNSRFLLKDFTVTHNTLLARAATAQIEGAAFFSPTPGELRGKYEGETEKNISGIFECAQKLLDEKNSKYRTAILFIDEFDAMAAARSDDPGMRRSVNAFLQAMDGMIRRENVSVVAATNYPWDLDEAILRRFTSRIFVDLPDKDAIEWLIRDALIKNYALPDASKKEMSMYSTSNNDKVWNNWIFSVIKKYGGKESCKRTQSGVFSSSVISTHFKAEDLDIIIKKLLPNTKAIEIKNKITQQIYDPDTVPGDASFGYSASDITKIMNIAIQDSAFNAMNGGFETININGKSYYVSSASGDISIKQIPEQYHNSILNFTICLDDILNAINKYPPTVIAKEYVKLLNYVSHGRPL